MTEEELARIEALANAATPGPWETYGSDRYGWRVDGPPDTDEGRISEENARFIAAARDAVPALVAEVRRLRNEIHFCSGSCRDEPLLHGITRTAIT